MKKIFAIALVGLISLTFVNDANAFDNDSSDIVFSIETNDSPVDAVAFEIAPVTTEFVFNVTVDSVNYVSVGDFGSAVNTEGFDLKESFVSNSETYLDVPIDYGIYSNNEFTVNEPVPNLTKPIDYANVSTNKFTLTKPIDYANISTNYFTLTEPIPNLTANVTEYENVTNYNLTNGYTSPEIVKGIVSNVGKLTS